MHLNKVEMGFRMDHVHMEVVLLIAIVFEAPAPLGWYQSLGALGSLMLLLLLLLVTFGPCCFRNSKLHEDIFYPVKLVEIVLHIGHRLGGLASVLRHQIAVDQCLDTVQTMFERYYLPAVGLAHCYGKNPQKIPPKVAHLFSLPLRDLAIGLFGD